MAGSDPDGLYYSNGGSDIGGKLAVDKETSTLSRNEAAQAEAATIDTCGNVRCAMDTVRNYSDPDYAAAAGAQFEQELEVQAGIQQEEADAQAAAGAASSGSGLWGEISDVVSTAATVLTVAAIATSWVPGLDCVTGALAIAADVTDAALVAVSIVDAYTAASSGDWAGAAGDVAMAALSLAGGGGGGEGAAGGGIASLTEDTASAGGSSTPSTLYHYTTEENTNKIVSSEELYPSLKDGQSQGCPVWRRSIPHRYRAGHENSRTTFSSVLASPLGWPEIYKLCKDRRERAQCRRRTPHVYVIPNSGSLNLSGRILGYGANQP